MTKPRSQRKRFPADYRPRSRNEIVSIQPVEHYSRGAYHLVGFSPLVQLSAKKSGLPYAVAKKSDRAEDWANLQKLLKAHGARGVKITRQLFVSPEQSAKVSYVEVHHASSPRAQPEVYHHRELRALQKKLPPVLPSLKKPKTK